ncbi:tetratricopeptide repeat-containing sensor histidine kinase [Thalassobellus sediminis]|uniref:tetratricopeptide repeat-containing sensor histidine kinase n=1 Tax=Thalassobellus sediminis TaxID=3367753 RepID=UPI0037885A0D
MYKNYFVIVFLTFFCLKTSGQTKTFKKQLDSIQVLRQLSKNTDFDLETRIQYAKKASELSYKTEVDSVILNSTSYLTLVYSWNKKYSRVSINIGLENLKLANKHNDSLNIAYINSDLGYAYHNLEKKDSAYYYYYNSLKMFENFQSLNINKNLINQSRILSNISNLQLDERDYIGAQANVIKAINLLLKIPKTEKSQQILWGLYNNLALNLDELKEYEKALEYFYKALDVTDKMESNYQSHLHTKINIAELYKEIKNYNKSIKIYNQLLKDETIEEKAPISYGVILNNMAYTMFLEKDKDYNKIDSLFIKAYNIFCDLDLFYEISSSGNDIAEFYYGTNQKDKALFYSKRSYEYGKKAKDYIEVLRALKMLSKLYEGNKGKAYLYEHIKLNDSLIDAERANRNKYARIQFETDQYIKETKRLSTQNILILVIAGIVILSLCLLYFINLQRDKNKTLLFEKEQQQASQEIYGLMLKQQAKLEEARLQERNRISEDLHDGILPRLFGTRMGMGFLELKGDESTLKQYNAFIDELQKIEKEVREVSHELKIDNIGLETNFESIIEVYIKTQSVAGNFKYKIVNEDEVKFELFNEFLRVEIYRILQEAIQNIVKHAKAKSISVSFTFKEGVLSIKIIDDGIGFDTEKMHKGIGLKNIASRLLKLDGKLKIKSLLNNKGTEIDIEIPVKKDF